MTGSLGSPFLVSDYFLHVYPTGFSLVCTYYLRGDSHGTATAADAGRNRYKP